MHINPSKEGFFAFKVMRKPIVVAKFGGTSVSTKDNIVTITGIIKKEKTLHDVIVVVSALSKVTDLLLSVASGEKDSIHSIKEKHYSLIADLWQDEGERKILCDFIDECFASVLDICNEKVSDKKMLDKVVSFGEIMSSKIIATYLTSVGILAKQIIASDVIVTDSNFGSAEFLPVKTKINAQNILLPLLSDSVVPVLTGFIGATENGETTTLGRGGSDYSGSIIGFAVNAKEVQIWTDVDGIFTADPRVVKNAFSIPEISFQEASEMAFLGAKVLHPRTMRPAAKAGIPVRVLNTFNPSSPGTIIVRKEERKSRITAITFKRKVVLVTIKAEQMFMTTGFLAKIFDIFKEANISVDLVSVSEVTVSLTLDMVDNLQETLKKIEKFSRVVIDEESSVVSVIGEHIGRYPHAVRDVFSILDKKNIRVKMISFSAQNRNISCVIKNTRWEDAVHALHDGLLLGGSK